MHVNILPIYVVALTLSANVFYKKGYIFYQYWCHYHYIIFCLFLQTLVHFVWCQHCCPSLLFICVCSWQEILFCISLTNICYLELLTHWHLKWLLIDMYLLPFWNSCFVVLCFFPPELLPLWFDPFFFFIVILVFFRSNSNVGFWYVVTMGEYVYSFKFKHWKGVHQGCILSPCLFNFYAGYIMRNAGLEETQAGIKIAGRNINNLRYADDTTLW